jgi:hypothetical protein
MRANVWAALIGLAVTGNVFAAFNITFEDIPGDVQAVNTFYNGVTFGSSSTGSPLVTRRGSTNNYNFSSWPSGTQYNSGYYWVYGDVGVTSALDNSGNDGKISFDNGDATFVEIGYSANSNFHLEAYNSLNLLLDSDTGGANLRYLNGNNSGPGTLRVDAPLGQFIKYVIVHDAGNFWVIDNVNTDATGIQSAVPELGSFLTTGLVGCCVIGIIRLGKRFAFKPFDL